MAPRRDHLPVAEKLSSAEAGAVEDHLFLQRLNLGLALEIAHHDAAARGEDVLHHGLKVDRRLHHHAVPVLQDRPAEGMLADRYCPALRGQGGETREQKARAEVAFIERVVSGPPHAIFRRGELLEVQVRELRRLFELRHELRRRILGAEDRRRPPLAAGDV